MRFPKEITTVTPFSKFVAFILFITLPTIFFFIGMHYQRQRNRSQIGSIVVPLPLNSIDTPTSSQEWATFTNQHVTFEYPSDWIKDLVLTQGSGYTQELYDPQGIFRLTFLSRANYNQLTGNEYVTLDEFIGMPYQVKSLTVDGYEARQPLPRAGSENFNSVSFFSPDKKMIYTLELEADTTNADSAAAHIQKGNNLFSTILSSFKSVGTLHTIESFGTIDTWSYFNQTYTTDPLRNFRFKYPSVFSVNNVDSGSVVLLKDAVEYLALEQTQSISTYPQGSTELEKFKNYYDYINNSYPYIDPPLIYKRIPLNNNNFVYKITYSGEGACGGGYFDEPEWYCYISEINGSGIRIADLRKISEDIIVQILNSVEFRQERVG